MKSSKNNYVIENAVASHIILLKFGKISKFLRRWNLKFWQSSRSAAAAARLSTVIDAYILYILVSAHSYSVQHILLW